MRCTSACNSREGVDLLGVRFGGDSNQRGLVRAALARCRSTALWHRLVVPTDKPARKRRVAVVANLLWRGYASQCAGPVRPRSRLGRQWSGGRKSAYAVVIVSVSRMSLMYQVAN